MQLSVRHVFLPSATVCPSFTVPPFTDTQLCTVHSPSPWVQGPWLPADVRRSRSEELDCGRSRAATLRQSDLVPASRSGSPAPQPQSLPPRQAGQKRGRATAAAAAADPAPAAARLQSRGSSKYKGVSWSERSSKWRAQMWFGNKVRLPPVSGRCLAPNAKVRRYLVYVKY